MLNSWCAIVTTAFLSHLWGIFVIKNVICDVDGVLTDGSFYYSNKGKVLKRFGSHDSYAIKIASNFFNIVAITADVRGSRISILRTSDMGLECHIVPESDRASWIRSRYEKFSTAFIADSFSDIPSLGFIGKSFAPQNAHPEFKKRVDTVLDAKGGEGAVAEALDLILWEDYRVHLWEYES